MNLYLVKLHKIHDTLAFLEISEEDDIEKATEEFKKKYGRYGEEIIYNHMSLKKIDSVGGYKVKLEEE